MKLSLQASTNNNMKMSHALGILSMAILGFLHAQASVHQVRVVQDPIDNRRVAVITWIDGDGARCRISTDPEVIQEAALRTTGEEEVLRPTEAEMREVREECDSLDKRQVIAEEEEEEGLLDGWNIIYPGTKWCGAGDVTKHDDDLGFYEGTDKCCRAHDKCDDIMVAWETKNNLTNKSPFTALSCKCDEDFFDCLSTVNSLTSNTIGNTYFNILRRPCYEKDYPKSNQCKNHTTLLRITCLKYERDTDAPQEYQWVSAKIYKQLPVPGPFDVKLPLSERNIDFLRRFLP